MTPEQFRDIAVEALDAARAEPLNFRLVLSAIALVDMFAAQIFHARPDYYRRKYDLDQRDDDLGFRDRIAHQNADFQVLRDLAKAQKHVVLTRGDPLVTRADQMRAAPGLFCAPFSDFCAPFEGGRFGEAQEIFVELKSGETRNVLGVAGRALSFLQTLL